MEFTRRNMTEQNIKKLYTVIDTELTQKQKAAFTEVVMNGRTQTDVAMELGVEVSTVNRHLKSAFARIYKFAKYF